MAFDKYKANQILQERGFFTLPSSLLKIYSKDNMKIVICTVNHIYSNKILKELIKEFGKDIKLVIESGALLQNKSKFQALIKYIRISGIYYVFIQTLKLEIFKCLSLIYTKFGNNTNNKFFHHRRLLKNLKIPVITLADINSPDALVILKKVNPDILVSVLFNQILKSDVIKSSSLFAIPITGTLKKPTIASA